MNQAASQPRLAALLAMFAAATFAVFALYGVMVQTEAGQDLDASAYSGDVLEPGIGAAHANRLLRTISVGSLALGTITISGIAVARGRFDLALVPVAVIAGSVVTTELLKDVVLGRPDLLGSGDSINSYPSGHTTVATSLGVAALLVVPRWMRPAVAIGAIEYASAIGVATVAGGWHRPSDVIGAYLVTFAIASIVLAAFFRYGREPGEPAPEPSHRAYGAVALGVVLGMVAVVAIAFAEYARGVEWTTVDRGFLASALVMPATAAGLIGGLMLVAWGPGPAPGSAPQN